MTAARQAIADAVSAVPDVTCTPTYRQSLGPGDAMVRLARTVPADNGFGHINTWQVWIGLPQDLATAEEWIDVHAPALLTAVRGELAATSLTPADLVITPGGPVTNGLILEGAREG